MAAQRQVEVVTAARGMPVWERMAGLTKMMYAMVMKVVRPATISVRHVVLWAAKPKCFSRRVSMGWVRDSRWGATGEIEWVDSFSIARGGWMTADQVKKLLGLRQHPREGGWYVRTYESGERVAAEAFADGRYAGPRHTGTAIYYLLESGTFSEMHRLKSDEVFHFYAGDAVEMLQLMEGGSGRMVRIGNDLAADERPQVLVPRGVWQGSRLAEGGKWALLGCTVSPGFEFEDYEAGERVELCAGWAEFREMIRELTKG